MGYFGRGGNWAVARHGAIVTLRAGTGQVDVGYGSRGNLTPRRTK